MLIRVRCCTIMHNVQCAATVVHVVRADPAHNREQAYVAAENLHWSCSHLTPQQWATRLIFLSVGFTVAAWAPLVPFAKARLGIDEGALGLLFLCLGAGSILAMPVTGVLATRYGCRAVLVAGVTVFSVTLPFLTIASGVAAMAVALAFFGAAVGTVDVAMNIQAVMVEKDSGRAMMSGFHGLFSLGGILGAGGMSGLLLLGASPLAAVLSFRPLRDHPPRHRQAGATVVWQHRSWRCSSLRIAARHRDLCRPVVLHCVPGRRVSA